MNLYSAPPELRLIVGLTATAAVAAFALMPHRIGLGFAHARAGFPITYATWRGKTVAEFSVGALAIDVALLLVVAGFWVWRYWAVKRYARFREHAQDVLAIIRSEHERL
jgi:hypothetical protein